MKKSFKIPKLVQKAAGKAAKQTVLITADDHLFEGTVEEESGDRWLALDLSKALRFYQRAYDHYKMAYSMAPRLVDAHYNAARLTFHIYNQYTKPDHVRFEDLENVGDVLGSRSSVVQSLEQIVKAHEDILVVAESVGIPWDLRYNTALAYTEILEQSVERDLSIETVGNLAGRTSTMFAEVLDTQVRELEEFVADITSEEDSAPEDTPNETNDGPKEVFVDVRDTVTPVVLLESILSSYRFIQSVYEAVSTEHIPRIHQLLDLFLAQLDSLASKTVAAYGSDLSEKQHLNLPYLSALMVDDLKIARAYATSASKTSFDELLAVWKGDIPKVPEAYMSTADSIQTLLDKECITPSYHMFLPSLHASQPELVWGLLGTMNVYYKKAQDVLMVTMKQHQVANSLLLSPVISTIAALLVARSDCELQRALLEFPAATTHREVLLKNARTLLVNAVNMANISGGLREGASDKLIRAKRRVEAVVRICVMDGEVLPEQLDKRIKRTDWATEIPNIRELGYYGFFTLPVVPLQF
ncbi:hypothetical protein BABINDRAFT_10833 [Babjeviella inositovora NRRL Y-12698]|uniref:Uncharacterized protein n=1 Tax=Babjeviella inositovora NRRL Y-12698 TaxID=984486 RepID=A0A1E3QZ73_9ASCO|nr:uncharacterized protein BABINDRAFT_10833 [Babjeviella inositovora NRRL Y-12698]ODQ82387.1 hypothetical protein BABINDRAFT_10833 [Babjeviella inositovora NRRL Y-12698]